MPASSCDFFAGFFATTSLFRRPQFRAAGRHRRGATFLAGNPALDIALLVTRDRERVARHVLRDRRARGDEALRLDLDGRDEIRVAADERAISDRTAGLLVAVVVHDDRAAAEVHAGTDVGIADIPEMSRFRSRPERRVLDLDEVADLHALPRWLPGADGPRADVTSSSSWLSSITQPDLTCTPSPSDESPVMTTPGSMMESRPISHVRIDIDALGIDEGDALGHMSLAMRRRMTPSRPRARARIDPQALVGIIDFDASTRSPARRRSRRCR